jgi:hypothetical protein
MVDSLKHRVFSLPGSSKHLRIQYIIARRDQQARSQVT